MNNDEDLYSAPKAELLKDNTKNESVYLLHLRLSFLYPIFVPVFVFLISQPFELSLLGDFLELTTAIFIIGSIVTSIGYATCGMYALVKSKTVKSLKKRIIRLPLSVSVTNFVLLLIPAILASSSNSLQFLPLLLLLSVLTVIVGYIYVIFMLSIPALIHKLSHKHSG